MTIYQVVDDQNHLICEYMDLERALNGVQDMAAWDKNHHYFVQELEVQVI